MSNTGKMLTILGIGVLAGAILGLLFAPDKGSETRRKISGQGKKMADDVQGKFRKGREKFNDLQEDVVKSMKAKVEEFS